MLSLKILPEHARQRFDLNQAFRDDPGRAQSLVLPFADWRIDVSRQHITETTLRLLCEYAEAQDLPRWIAALFAGERLNVTEGRAALHTALRQNEGTPLYVEQPGGKRDAIADVRAAQEAMRELALALREGRFRGAGGQPVRAVVNLGIGGSALGPQLACDALYAGGDFEVRFVANLDPQALHRAVHDLDPASTLFIVVSKTFTTEETLANAADARAWLQRHSHSSDTHAWARQFVAVTANGEAARAFGVPEAQILPFWDWVGGRFSLWSAVGVTLAIQSGWLAFSQLLDGAAAMDWHFRSAPLPRNAPVMLALIDWWNVRYQSRRERVIVPYAEALRLLPAYLQQLLMESNGKRVGWNGEAVNADTVGAVWGGVGTDSQHAFFQWLHQGTHRASVEFIVPVRTLESGAWTDGEDGMRPGLAAHALAQAQALMCGRDGCGRVDGADALAAARACPGNVPSTMLLLPQLDAWHLGALLALYEHRTFIEGVLYGVNPFDQFGVELGKALARPLRAALEQDAPLPAQTDAATLAQLDYVRRHRSAATKT